MDKSYHYQVCWASCLSSSCQENESPEHGLSCICHMQVSDTQYKACRANTSMPDSLANQLQTRSPADISTKP